jgi:RNA polymerase sigma-70 factor, ECF subfamily
VGHEGAARLIPTAVTEKIQCQQRRQGMTDDSAINLLKKAQHGDKKAMEEWLQDHQAHVYRFGLQMCRDPDDASEVLQETLLAAARSLPNFRGESSITTWLYSIARSFCLKKRRTSKFAPTEQHSLDTDPLPEIANLSDATHSPEDQLAEKQREHVVQQAIAALKPSYREVLVLRDIEGLTASEVAEVVGIPVQSVKSRLHRARNQIRNAVQPWFQNQQQSKHPSFSEPCPDVLHLYSHHLEGDIGPELCEELARHLEQCAHCRAECDSLKATLRLCKNSAGKVEVPVSIQNSVKRAWQNFLDEKK